MREGASGCEAWAPSAKNIRFGMNLFTPQSKFGAIGVTIPDGDRKART
jgi:hypothetical protein